MFGLIRIGAYLVSALTAWQFFQGDVDGIHSLHKQLALDPARGMLFGVCAGVSDYTGIDVSIIRFAWALLVLYRGAGILLYILAFLIMPSMG
ncbi:PspC domain-containing protein [Pelosinus propionicus]|uniref:Phage shock protein PspC (Stress-responsive transcriptional regulator) n=1 Tax=Pelosinus propionicus DSM 13327 TaxID=1123291 RepID=A0A1I4HMJ8_9FIRM|nr:PspC domain-containing protein [Pelosinus propionicus]SFL42963.1 Phage shock protein PspC (stress-responsive transcriptional regulator) [Pelosinus propionicus DSM 13327]